MTKQDLIDYIVLNTGYDKADVMRMFDAVLMGITSGLKNDGKVTITGFCTFSLKEKSERKGRNPRTGEVIDIPAKKTVIIKAGSKLKYALK